MKKIQSIIILFIISGCVLWGRPESAYADSIVEPPTEVETNHKFTFLGEVLPEGIMVLWKDSVTEGVSGYNVYEIVTVSSGQEAYVKIGSAEAGETGYFIWLTTGMDMSPIMGLHRFAVTAVMPDGQESGYSEIAESRIYRHQRIREKKTDISGISIEWDAPEFGSPDTYEIWYCEDVYSYWEYDDVYYGSGVSSSDIVYKKVQNLPESTKDYAVTGLKPDTPYVFMVRSFQDGQVLDRSKFLQARTATLEWTQVSVVYKETSTGETIKTETINNLKPGAPYTYQPVPSFEADGKVYTLDRSHAGQLLNIAALSGNPEKNTITVYYTGKEKEPEAGRKETEVGRALLKKPARVSWKKAKVKWAKVPGAKGYQAVYADNPKFKKAKKKTTAKTSLTLKKLKKGKAYYVKVRAYALDPRGNKIYGKFSKKKKIPAR